MYTTIYLVTRSLRSTNLDTAQHSEVSQQAYECLSDAYRDFYDKRRYLFEYGYEITDISSSTVFGKQSLPIVHAFGHGRYVELSIKLIYLFKPI